MSETKKDEEDWLKNPKPLFDMNISLKEQEMADTKEHLNKQYKQIKIQNVILTLTVIVAIITLIIFSRISFQESVLIRKQLESIAPLLPNIEVHSIDFPEDQMISVFQIADILKDTSETEFFSTSRIRFVLINKGRIRSNSINAELISDSILASGGHLDNLDGESYDYLEFIIRYKECRQEPRYADDGFTQIGLFINPDCKYKLGAIPLGWQDFNLELSCDFCENKIKTYKFCIYDDNKFTRKDCETSKEV